MKVDDHPEQTLVRQELLQASLGALMDWIASFAHPLVTQQMLRQLGASLAQRGHARIQLTQGHMNTQHRKSSGLSFQNLLQECGWETRLSQESKQHLDLAIPTCPFGSQAAGSQNFCALHSAVCGEAALYQFGYAKISLQRGPETPPRDCSIRVYTVRSEESLAADGVDYTSDPDHNGVPPVVAMHDGTFASLSPRECEVLRLVGDGLTDKEIASTLNLSVRTAENHVARVRDKLDIRGRAGLIRFAFQHHLNSV